MKTLKTSNIVLLAFSLVIILFVILKIVNSTYHPNSNSKNAVYTELKIDNIQSFKYLVLDGYREVTYEVKTGNVFKTEVFSDPRNTDSCKIHFSNDTLYMNVINNEGYTNCSEIPDVKICIPSEVKTIFANKVHCNLNEFKQDTLNIQSLIDYTTVNIEGSKIQTINYIGKDSKLALYRSDTIETLNFIGKGENSSLDLYDIVINKLRINKDSTRVTLSGKAIEYYMNK
ncbi:MAG: hypothetical protein ACOYLE_10360, partial [Bacteroidales bacterium]